MSSPVHTLGVDLAKRVIQVHGADANGHVVLRRRMPREDVFGFFKTLPPCLVGIEAGSGSNFFGQQLIELGHEVKLMPASYVKPYVKTNKNDKNDAEAICEAVRRPNMRFVPVKSKDQQAILSLHRTRYLLTRQKVSLTNSIKAMLAEFGIVVARHSPGVKDAFGAIEEMSSGLPELARTAMQLLVEQWRATVARIKSCGQLIKQLYKRNPACLRLGTIPGISALAATALYASVGDGQSFRSGRSLAAWLGLVPRQHSSGERQVLGRISKRGDPYLRRLFVMGAMSIMRVGEKSRHPIVHWAMRLADRKRYKLGVIALANKLARIAWAVLARGETFQEKSM